MTVMARTRRRRTAVMLAVNLLSLVALGGMGYAGYKALRRYEGATRVEETFISLPFTPVGMIAVVDGADQLASVVIAVLHPAAAGYRGGSLISVPVSADTGLGVDGVRIPLAEVYATGGGESLVVAVESAVGVTVDHWQVASPDELEVILAPLAPLAVDLPADVYDGPANDPNLIQPAGPEELSAEQWVDALTARVDGQTDRQRRAVAEVLWGSVAAAAGSGSVTVPDVAPSPSDAPQPMVVGSVGELFERLMAGPAAARGVATSPLPLEDAPAGVDIEQLDFADAVMVFASIAPSATTSPRQSLVHRIEAPPGYDEQVKRAVEILLYVGGNVQSVYIGADVQERPVTEFELYSTTSRDDVEASNELFGSYKFVEPEVRIEGVEVVVRLGMEFLTGQTGSNPLPSTTTTTTIG